MCRWVSLPRPALPHSAPQAGSHPQSCRGCSPKYCNWLWRWSRSSVMHPGPAIPQCPGKRWGQFCIALRHQHDPRWQPRLGMYPVPLVITQATDLNLLHSTPWIQVWAPAWSSISVQTTDIIIALCCCIGHRHQHYFRQQYKAYTLTWAFVVARVSVSFYLSIPLSFPSHH